MQNICRPWDIILLYHLWYMISPMGKGYDLYSHGIIACYTVGHVIKWFIWYMSNILSLIQILWSIKISYKTCYILSFHTGKFISDHQHWGRTFSWYSIHSEKCFQLILPTCELYFQLILHASENTYEKKQFSLLEGYGKVLPQCYTFIR